MGLFSKPLVLPLEDPQLFLVVKTADHMFGFEYYPATQFAPSHPDPSTLVVTRRGVAAYAKRYGPRGWYAVWWEMRRPADIARYRADRRTPTDGG